MRLILLFIFLCSGIKLKAQMDSFDLITYLPPGNWVKMANESIVSYTVTGNNNKSWCRINIVKSTVSKGDNEQDFESEWQQLIVKNYSPYGDRQLKNISSPVGWTIKSGTSVFNFDNKAATAILTTATGFNRCLSIVVVTNTNAYLQDIEKMLSSVVLPATMPHTRDAGAATNQDQANVYKKIIGTWGVGNTVASAQNMNINEGSVITQYSFKADGTYTFYIKTFRYQSDRILLTRETGVYSISNDKLVVSPKKSMIEAWSRKDGTDKWGRLLSTKNNSLEKISYTFSVENFGTGWALILKSPVITKRDGIFNNSNKDAWFYPAKSDIEIIELPAK